MFSFGLYCNRKLLMTDKHLVARFYSLFVEWAEFSRLIADSGDFFLLKQGSTGNWRGQ